MTFSGTTSIALSSLWVWVWLQVRVITSEIDHGLDDNNRVIPGMGSFGDRYFGT